VTCAACQHENPPAAKFCQQCGARLGTACARCGTGLPADARFCHECGAAAPGAPATPAPRSYTPRHLADEILRSRSALEGERKQVTVLFADVKGSVELSEQVDAEEWHRLLDGFFQILAEGVHRYEGTINQYTGDGIMALFGAPIAHEDHAQRACYAALFLLDELRRYANTLRVERGLNFAVRIGINSGEVVVAAIGDDLRMDYTAQGHTVGLAARMQQIAEPGKAYLSEHTARLVSGFFRLVDLGKTELKGVRASVGVYELAGVGSLRTRLDLSRARGFSRFVGRKDELAELRRAWEETLAGRGRVVGVVGEPGVGKSRLCLEFVESARAGGVAVYEAQCPPHGSTLPLRPILQLLRALFDVREDDDDHAARRKVAGELLLLDPEFQEWVPLVLDFLGLPDPARPPLALDSRSRAEKLSAFLRRLVRARSERGPFALLVDDLHWIDPASDALLGDLAAAASEARALLLVNFRPEYRAAWAQPEHYGEIPLAPLSSEAQDELLRDLLGADPSVRELRSLVRERTAGNPFFMEELVQSLVESGELAGERGRYRLARPVAALQVPATVQAVLAARMDRLPEDEKSVLQAASVIGKRFTVQVLARVLGVPEGDLARALGSLERAEFVRLEALHPESEYAFRHPLTQEVAYGSQLSERRRELHASVARALADANPARRAELAPLLAQHFEAAGDPLEAARWHRRAADAVQARDFGAAERHFRRVRELVTGEPLTDTAHELAVAARAGILLIGGRQGLPKEEAEALFDEGKRLLEGRGHRAQLALVEYAYGLSCVFSGDFEEALLVFGDAEASARAGGIPALALGARVSTAHVGFALGRLADALARVDSALADLGADPALAAAFGTQGPGVTSVWSLRATALLYLGRLEEAEHDVERSLEIAHARRQLEWVGMGHGTRGSIAIHRGDADRALAEGRRAIEVAERIGYVNARLDGLLVVGAAHLLRGEWRQAIASLEPALADTQRTGNVLSGPQITAYLSEAWLGTGDAPRAVALAKGAVTASALRKSLHREAQAQLALGHALLVEQGRGALRGAESALARAEALVAESGARLLAPHVELLRAAVGAARGDAALSARALGTAQRLFHDLGAAGHAQRVAGTPAAG
jgi:class 3 adenylate cyclase/tetratricopeptide (TPR) repeat protein